MYSTNIPDTYDKTAVPSYTRLQNQPLAPHQAEAALTLRQATGSTDIDNFLCISPSTHGTRETSQHTRSISIPMSEAFSAAAARAPSSTSNPTTVQAPRMPAAMPSIPVPQPRSSTARPSMSPYSNSAVYTIRAARWGEVLKDQRTDEDRICDRHPRQQGRRWYDIEP